MVFFFSATGNSLYVAKHLDSKPISIPQIMRKATLSFKDETIGIVCPIYGSEPPYMVQDFLKKAKFDTKYFYMVMTYGCSNGAASKIIQEFTKENGIDLSYMRTVKMVDNYLPGFDMEEEKKLDKKIEEQIESIVQDIKAQKHELEQTAEEDMAVYENYLSFTKEHPELGWKQLRLIATDACAGCGLCVKVCPAGCIQIKNGRAVHNAGKCQKCLACIHNCPHSAICMSVPEQNSNARFRNEHIGIDEIIMANNQN